MVLELELVVGRIFLEELAGLAVVELVGSMEQIVGKLALLVVGKLGLERILVFVKQLVFVIELLSSLVLLLMVELKVAVSSFSAFYLV